MTAAFPLTWPDHIPRSKTRERGSFRTTLATALKNVERSVHMFGKDSGKTVYAFVISSNVTLGREKPPDPGVAVWFTWDGIQVCIPVDRYQSVEANLQAIHLIIEARRTELRHGTLALVRATFLGLKALPPPSDDRRSRSWREVLGISEHATKLDAEKAYRHKASEQHPDKGGSPDAMAALNAAIAAARKELT